MCITCIHKTRTPYFIHASTLSTFRIHFYNVPPTHIHTLLQEWICIMYPWSRTSFIFYLYLLILYIFMSIWLKKVYLCVCLWVCVFVVVVKWTYYVTASKNLHVCSMCMKPQLLVFEISIEYLNNACGSVFGTNSLSAPPHMWFVWKSVCSMRVCSKIA